MDCSQEEGNKLHTLERKYVELLEKRIAALEASLEPSEDKKSNGETSMRTRTENKEMDEVPSKSANDTQTKSRIRFRERRYNEHGVSEEHDVEDPQLSRPDLTAREDTSMTVLRTFDEDKKLESTEILIQGEDLRALLQYALAHYPGYHFSSDSIAATMTLASPYEAVIHTWEKLNQLATPQEDNEQLNSLKNDLERSGPLQQPLATLADKGRLAQARSDLEILLAHVRNDPSINEYFTELNIHGEIKNIPFDLLWTAFCPGDLVYTTALMGQPQVLIVKESRFREYTKVEYSHTYEEDRRNQWVLVCWTYDWDGKSFNRVPVVFTFSRFQGSVPIRSLHVHPMGCLGHHPGSVSTASQDLRNMLIRRGQRFRKLCLVEIDHPQMFRYDGEAIAHGRGFGDLEPKSFSWDLDGDELIQAGRRSSLSEHDLKNNIEREKVTGPVMVDAASFLRHVPRDTKYGPMGAADQLLRSNECNCASCISNDALQENQRVRYDGESDPKATWDDDQYMICPPRVLGYHLGKRTWLQLDISETNETEGKEYLSEIREPVSEDSFHKLQLASMDKDLIKDLVESHTSGTGKVPLMEDIIKDKGRGLVILLHGPPGVGKTLTAESVAQLAGKPLFQVTTADMGRGPQHVEENLSSLFELAARWRAVLLFDEADVFLESRSSHSSNLERNSYVSVLLRILEYYEGILILTTNRIQNFDIAVQSRVNLGIKYKNLTPAQKKNIFDNFIDQLRDEDIDDRDELKAWFSQDLDANEWFEPLNGRQVRNVLFSASSLAAQKGGVLKKAHLVKLAKSTWKFQDSIKSIVSEARKKAEVGFVN